jgi:hypothetical protein
LRVRIAGVLGAVVLGAGLVGASSVRAQTIDDYHLAAFGDPMDFSNPEDAILNTTEAMMIGTSNRSISDGQLRFDAAGIFRFDAVWPGYPTGIPHGREGGRVPIDASQYRRLVIRMNAPEGAPLGVRWYSCLEQTQGCTGGQAFAGRGGWQTYDLALGEGADGSLPVPWSGQLVGLSIVGNASGRFEIDYVRLVGAGTADIGEVTQGGPSPLFRDDRLDFATAAGDPWDMSGPGDVTVANLRPGWTVASGRLSGCTLGTAGGRFPQIFFTLPGGRAIDADRFNTLTFEYSYEGTFTTKPVPGGGAFARVFWYDESGARRPTQAIHLYPNERAVQVRLNDPRAVFTGVEGGRRTGKPWGGRVTKVSINPSDDKAPRCFTIGRVTLTSDEPAGAALPAEAPTAAAPKATTKAAVRATSKKPATRKPTTKKTAAKKTAAKK